MLEVVRGNLFEANVEALVNAVNTIGVMGKGIALQFSRKFPEILPTYKAACLDGSLTVGKVQTIRLSLPIGVNRYVINFPTKKHWKDNSKLEYIESGLEALRTEIERLQIKSIAVPPLGCGLGGLNWIDVRQKIVELLGGIEDVKVIMFEPIKP